MWSANLVIVTHQHLLEHSLEEWLNYLAFTVCTLGLNVFMKTLQSDDEIFSIFFSLELSALTLLMRQN